MANKTFTKEKPVRLFDQMIALKAAFPTGPCEIKNNILWWGGKIRPSPVASEYTVLLTYKLDIPPKVWVLGDELKRLNDPNFPHHFDINYDTKMVRLCLYRYSEFTKYKLLAKTIIPWTVEWLFFYEIWLATGEWCGGGEHPNIGEQKKPDTWE